MRSILQNVGPGPAKYSKRAPIGRAQGTIGNTKRFLNIDDVSTSPGPDIYNPHKKLTDPRFSTREKNSPNCRFGTAKKHQPLGPATPGPQNYCPELCQPQIGDRQSAKVPFPTAQRFDARLSTALGTHARRRSGIPSGMNLAGNGQSRRPQSIETSHSPGPGHYRNQQAHLMSKKPPVCTIGNTKRFLVDGPISKVAATPGPSDYKI